MNIFQLLKKSNTLIKLPRPTSGGLILSYKCSAECLHCIYGCSPKWSDDWMSETDLQIILNLLAGKIEASPYGPEIIGLSHGLHITGGEPFLNYELLCRAIEIAHELKIPSLYVETNCFWALNDKTTRDKLLELKSKGMHGIMVSVNPFYLEYVPFERTERAIRISVEIFGQNVAIYQYEYYRRFKMLEIRYRLTLENYLKLEPESELLRNVEFFPMGRAAYELEKKLSGRFPRRPGHYFYNQPCNPPFLREWHNHFDNYMNYIPGYCGGISLGDCRKLDQLIREGIDLSAFPVLNFLIYEDFEGLNNFARTMGFEELPEGYLSKCHFCIELRSFLVKHGHFSELQPVEFYKHIRNDKTDDNINS